jgi:DNA-binding CsgD family transcriptional regulator
MPVVDVVTTERAAFEAWRRGEVSAAIDGMAAAAEEWCRRGFVRFAARAHVAVARAAAGNGLVGRSARHLDAARGMAERWRLMPIRAEVEAAERELDCARHRAAVSPRELAVLELVATGATTSAIADRLAISEHTVVTHINSARTKLGAATRVQAASMVARR